MQTLTNCTVLAVDAKDTVYPKARVQIQGGRILAVGSEDAIPLDGEIVDLGGGLVLPGLVNTHTHSHSSIFRSQADDLRLMDWLKKAMWPMERVLSPELAYAATALSCLEYLRCGITTYADQFYFSSVIAKAACAVSWRLQSLQTLLRKPVIPSARRQNSFRTGKGARRKRESIHVLALTRPTASAGSFTRSASRFLNNTGF